MRTSVGLANFINIDAARKLLANLVLFSATLLVACVKSPPPKVSDLIKVGTPTFDKKLFKAYTIPSHTFTLSGECDLQSRLLEYTYDEINWNKIADGCPAGTFTI